MQTAKSVALAGVVLMSACAGVQRRDLGEVRVTSTPPLIENQLIDTFSYRVEEGRIFMTAPGNPTRFDLAEEAPGCLRGNVRGGGLRQICRLPAAPDDPLGLSRWKSDSSTLIFTAELSPDRSRVIIDAGYARAEFKLGAGAAADELRAHPELLGGAFATGHVPRAGGAAKDDEMRDFTFVVAAK